MYFRSAIFAVSLAVSLDGCAPPPPPAKPADNSWTIDDLESFASTNDFSTMKGLDKALDRTELGLKQSEGAQRNTFSERLRN